MPFGRQRLYETRTDTGRPGVRQCGVGGAAQELLGFQQPYELEGGLGSRGLEFRGLGVYQESQGFAMSSFLDCRAPGFVLRFRDSVFRVLLGDFAIQGFVWVCVGIKPL